MPKSKGKRRKRKSFVPGHFKIVKGKRVYVKGHMRGIRYKPKPPRKPKKVRPLFKRRRLSGASSRANREVDMFLRTLDDKPGFENESLVLLTSPLLRTQVEEAKEIGPDSDTAKLVDTTKQIRKQLKFAARTGKLNEETLNNLLAKRKKQRKLLLDQYQV